MASLVETLIDVLNQENEEYKKLLELSEYKTGVIVKGDTDELQNILLKEQARIDLINKLEEKRQENVADICNVLNLKKKDIKLEDIITVLEKQPKEHKQLQEIHADIKRTLNQLIKINENNKLLITETLDMVEFELNVAKNSMLAPQTANYGKGAYSDNNIQTINSFDAKQ